MSVTPESRVEVVNAPSVVPTKPTAGRAYIFSPDWTKRRTWWVDAIKITDEAHTGDGATTTFQLAHGTGVTPNEAVLDLTRGLITDDHLIVAPGDQTPGGYRPVVKVDGMTKTMRRPHEGEGGDWWLDFDTGLLTFSAAPVNQAAITVTYYYVPATVGPCLRFTPPPGKRWVIDFAEAQVSKNVSFDDCIIMQVFAGDGITPLAAPVRYENAGNILDYSYGSFVEYPAIGSAYGRGLVHPTMLFRWNYLSPIVLYSSRYGGMTIKAWTENKRPFGGERMTLVFYALEENEEV